jgi:hypothetical protein
MNQTRSPLVYVYKLRIACPVCRRRDGGCSITHDRSQALCWKVPSSRPTSDGQYYWHDLTEGQAKGIKVPETVPEERERVTAPIDRRDAVYSRMLDALALTSRHNEELKARGLSPEAIEAARLRTLPTLHEAVYITDALASEFELENVPGFFRAKNGAYGIKLSGYLTFQGGFIIPVCDPFGRVQALQIRRNRAEEAKYIWLSSADLDPEKFPEVDVESGASSKAPAHYAGVEMMRRDGAALITEGALKSICISHMAGCGVIGFGGLIPPADFLRTLKESLPEVRAVELAFDSDWRDRMKPNVKKALFKVLSEMRVAGYSVSVKAWSPTFKGLDDLLAAQKRRERAA